MKEIYISLGSNLGQRQRFITMAIDNLSKLIKIEKVSSLYKTAPWGKTDQPDFLNICLKAKTNLSADDLLAFIKTTESGLGRSHSEKWGPREIDIDILFYGSEIIDQPGLVIPHQHLHERAFVLVSLDQIAPELIHPKFDKTIRELTKNIDKKGVDLYEP